MIIRLLSKFAGTFLSNDSVLDVLHLVDAILLIQSPCRQMGGRHHQKKQEHFREDDARKEKETKS